MADVEKTKDQLLNELKQAKLRIEELEALEEKRKRAEETLRESEEKFSKAFKATAVLMAITTIEEGRFIEVNDTFLKSLGYERDEVIGKTSFELEIFSPASQRDDIIKEVKATGHTRNYEVIVGTKNGEKRHGLFSADVIRLKNRDCLISIMSDVTDRKLAEEELQKLALVVQYSDELVNMSTLDGTMTFINEAGGKMLGIDPDEVEQANIMEVIPDHFKELVTNELLPTLMEGDVWKGELQYLNLKTGNLTDVYATTFTVKDPNTEEPLFLANVSLDITERKRAENALKESEQKYRLLFDAARMSIVYYDTNGKILLLNEYCAEFFGEEIEEIIGRSVYEFFHPDMAEIVKERDLKVIESGESAEYEDFIDFPTGPQWFWSSLQPVKDSRGTIIGIQVISYDITERMQAEKEKDALEKQVQHMQKLESLGVLAGGIAHDFNNLLTGILGNVGLALNKIPKTSPERENLDGIEKAAMRAADLCRQMLAYSGKGRFVIEVIDLSEVVEEMANILDVSISKKAMLKYNFAGNVPFIEADATQLRQIILNLIINASEALGSESGIITIHTGVVECDREYLSGVLIDDELPEGLYSFIEVSDTGVGMDKETLSKIFDPFFTTKFTGRGLGLSAVLGIIRGHKGTVKIYSEPGKGTTFKVLFPAVEKAMGKKKPVEQVSESWSGGGTILLVDDEDTVLQVVTEMLIECNFDVLTAVDGREALAVFEDHVDEIVCVILDLTMPNMDGEEAFREMRRMKKDVSVIISSGYNEQEVAQRFIGKGMAGFIQKPYRLEKLIEKLKTVLV